MVILLFVLVWIGLIVILTAGTLFLQGYFNENPPEIKELAWRGPAAGSAVASFTIFWCFMASGSPERFASFTEFSATEEYPPYQEMYVAPWNILKKTYEEDKSKWTRYRLRYNERGGAEYRDVILNRPMPSRPDSLIVVENKKEVWFKPQRDENGRFQADKGMSLRYIDEATGRYMEVGFLGRISTFYFGRLLVYLLLNLLHGAIWFVSIWLLLRFPVWQSFGMAFVCWLIMTLLVLPPLINRVTRKPGDDQARRQWPIAETKKAVGRRNLPTAGDQVGSGPAPIEPSRNG